MKNKTNDTDKKLETMASLDPHALESLDPQTLQRVVGCFGRDDVDWNTVGRVGRSFFGG